MPKAPMHKNGGLAPRQDKIGDSGKVGAVKPKATAHEAKNAPHGQLGAGVLRADAAHDRRTLLWRNCIHP